MIDTKHARDLCEAATPGPWKRAEIDPELVVQDNRNEVVWIAGCDFGKDQPNAKANARFIAESRTLLPAALEEIERLREAIVSAALALHGAYGELEIDQTSIGEARRVLAAALGEGKE